MPLATSASVTACDAIGASGPSAATAVHAPAIPTAAPATTGSSDSSAVLTPTETLEEKIEEKVEVKDAKQILGDVLAIGNVAPVRALLNGSPDDVLREANKCFEDGVDLLSSGCAVPPLTTLENLRAMAASAKTQ